MGVVSDLPADNELFQFTSRSGHRREPLAEGNHLQPIRLQLCAELSCVPAVECDLLNVEAFCVRADALADDVVIDHIARSRLNESLPNPDVIWDPILLHTTSDVLFRHPEPAEDLPSFPVNLWW